MCRTASRPVLGMSKMLSSGKPALLAPVRSVSAMAMLERIDSEQDDCVSRLCAKYCRVTRHIRTRLVDDSDNPDGNAHFGNVQSVGTGPFGDDFSTGSSSAATWRMPSSI